MLVLTRRPGESIRIGDEISVRVLDIHRGQVRVAIDAPRSIPVHREEVYALVQEQNRKAAEGVAASDPTALWQHGADERGET